MKAVPRPEDAPYAELHASLDSPQDPTQEFATQSYRAISLSQDKANMRQKRLLYVLWGLLGVVVVLEACFFLVRFL